MKITSLLFSRPLLLEDCDLDTNSQMQRGVEFVASVRILSVVVYAMEVEREMVEEGW